MMFITAHTQARGKLAKSVLLFGCLLFPIVAQTGPLGTKGQDFLYQVESGDTLGDLAQRYTLQWSNWEKLQKINQIEDSYRLPIANVLHIPLSMIPRQPATATVTHVAGRVMLDQQVLSVGDLVQAGQQLHSVQNGTATLQLADQSLLTLEPGATLHFEHLQIFQGSGLTDTILSLPAGSLESSVAPGKTGVGRFEVRSPATVTGVRGTRLRVHVDSQGSRHEVLKGRAAVDGQSTEEQLIQSSQGSAYNALGGLLGTRALLPAPQVTEHKRSGSSWLLNFLPVPQAVAYRIQIARDPAGSQRETSQRVTEPTARVTAYGSGQRHIFIRAIDSLGLEGQDATLTLDFLSGLLRSDGTPVLSSDGTPIRLQQFD